MKMKYLIVTFVACLVGHVRSVDTWCYKEDYACDEQLGQCFKLSSCTNPSGETCQAADIEGQFKTDTKHIALTTCSVAHSCNPVSNPTDYQKVSTWPLKNKVFSKYRDSGTHTIINHYTEALTAAATNVNCPNYGCKFFRVSGTNLDSCLKINNTDPTGQLKINTEDCPFGKGKYYYNCTSANLINWKTSDWFEVEIMDNCHPISSSVTSLAHSDFVFKQEQNDNIFIKEPLFTWLYVNTDTYPGCQLDECKIVASDGTRCIQDSYYSTLTDTVDWQNNMQIIVEQNVAGRYRICVQCKTQDTQITVFSKPNKLTIINCNYQQRNLDTIKSSYSVVTQFVSALAGVKLSQQIRETSSCPMLSPLKLVQNGQEYRGTCISIVNNAVQYTGKFCNESNLQVQYKSELNLVLNSTMFSVNVEPSCELNKFSQHAMHQLKFYYNPRAAMKWHFTGVKCSLPKCCQNVTYNAIRHQNNKDSTIESIKVVSILKTAFIPLSELGTTIFYIHGSNEHGQSFVSDEVSLTVYQVCIHHEQVTVSKKMPQETVIVKDQIFWQPRGRFPTLIVNAKVGQFSNTAISLKDRFEQKLRKMCKISNFMIDKVFDSAQKIVERARFESLFTISSDGVFKILDASQKYTRFQVYIKAQVDGKWHQTSQHLVEITYSSDQKGRNGKAEKTDNTNKNIKANSTGLSFVKSKPVKTRIRRMNRMGEMKIHFSQRMKIPSNLDQIDSSKLAVELILTTETRSLNKLSSLQEAKEFFNVDWQVSSFSSQELEIKVHINNSYGLSQGEDRDSIKVTFKDHMFWRAANGMSTVNGAEMIKETSIPRMFSRKTEQTSGREDSGQIQTVEVVQAEDTTITSAQVAMGFFLTLSMNFMVGSIDSLHTIVFQLCIVAFWPVNLSFAQEVLIQILNFEIFETSDLLSPIMDFEKDYDEAETILESKHGVLNNRLEEMGFNTLNPILNMGGIYFVLLWTMFKASVAAVLKILESKVSKTQKEESEETKLTRTERLKRFFKTNVISFPVELMFHNLSFLFFTTLLFIQQGQEYGKGGDGFTNFASTTFGWMCVISSIFMFCLSFLLLLLPTRFLQEGFIFAHFGNIYKNISLQRRANLFYLVFFVLKRTSLVLMIYYASSIKGLSWQIFMLFNTVFYQIYTMALKPFVDRASMWHMMLNEALIYLSVLGICLLTDFTSVEKFKSLQEQLFFRTMVGWVQIILIVLCIFINFFIIMWQNLGRIKKICQACYKIGPIYLKKLSQSKKIDLEKPAQKAAEFLEQTVEHDRTADQLSMSDLKEETKENLKIRRKHVTNNISGIQLQILQDLRQKQLGTISEETSEKYGSEASSSSLTSEVSEEELTVERLLQEILPDLQSDLARCNIAEQVACERIERVRNQFKQYAIHDFPKILRHSKAHPLDKVKLFFEYTTLNKVQSDFIQKYLLIGNKPLKTQVQIFNEWFDQTGVEDQIKSSAAEFDLKNAILLHKQNFVFLRQKVLESQGLTSLEGFQPLKMAKPNYRQLEEDNVLEVLEKLQSKLAPSDLSFSYLLQETNDPQDVLCDALSTWLKTQTSHGNNASIIEEVRTKFIATFATIRSTASEVIDQKEGTLNQCLIKKEQQQTLKHVIWERVKTVIEQVYQSFTNTQ